MLPTTTWHDAEGNVVALEDMVGGEFYINDQGETASYTWDSQGNLYLDIQRICGSPDSAPETTICYAIGEMPSEDGHFFYASSGKAIYPDGTIMETTTPETTTSTETEMYPHATGDFNWFPLIWVLLAIIIIGILSYLSFFTVKTQQAGIVERFGKFKRIAKPGLNVKIPVIDQLSAVLSLRVQTLNEQIATKTKDDVTVTVLVPIQYSVDASSDETIYAAAYSLTNVERQIKDYVAASVRSVVPSLTLDEAFASIDDIADRVGKDLSETMAKYGYTIVRALVKDIEPPKEVRDAMNEINAAERLAIAAKSKAKADKTKIIGAAEGEAAAKKLSGEGIANMRKAISDGLAAQYQTLKDVGINDADGILLANQWMDTMAGMARDGRLTTVFLPSSATGAADVGDQIRNAVLTADAAKH